MNKIALIGDASKTLAVAESLQKLDHCHIVNIGSYRHCSDGRVDYKGDPDPHLALHKSIPQDLSKEIRYILYGLNDLESRFLAKRHMGFVLIGVGQLSLQYAPLDFRFPTQTNDEIRGFIDDYTR